MMDFTPGIDPMPDHVVPLIDGSIGLLETTFPGRIRAYYLTGSFAEGAAVAHRDRDMIIVFKAAFQPGEADRLRQLRHHASKLSPFRLDLTPKCEADLFARGATGLKTAAQFLFGEDIREQIPFEPIEQYRHDVIHGFTTYQREIRGASETLPEPVTYPDPDAEFFGYEKFGNWHRGDHFEPGTRLLINLTTIGATASLTVLHDERAGSKQQAVSKYRQMIGDEWGNWLAQLYRLAKIELGYELPPNTAVRRQLRQLIQRTPEYENLVLARIQPYRSESCH